MSAPITRRQFLAMSAGATTLGLGACLTSSSECVSDQNGLTCKLPAAQDAPFDTVVVLMMENRSFDHILGWLPGANGKQAGLSYVDEEGIARATWPLARDWQGCRYQDPHHTWEGIAIQYADGRCDGFLKTRNDRDRPADIYPISYYSRGDLPILAALASNYTTFDNYFCSIQGPTWENRLYQLTGTTQVGMDKVIDHFPEPGEERPCNIQTAIFDRVRASGLTTRYYYHGEPMTGLFKSRRYDDISFPIEQFWEDARRGGLANVVFVDPDYTDCAEDIGTSNDYHHQGSVLVAEAFVAKVHNALKDSPQWDRMVFVLNFDEHGGFYDHVVPPACQDDTLQTGPGPFPNLKVLGFRVPAIAMGPFAPQKIEKAGPYEHCSILKMIEWRWNLEPLTLRDRYAKNFADALDFTRRRAAITLPPFDAPPPDICGVCPVERRQT